MGGIGCHTCVLLTILWVRKAVHNVGCNWAMKHGGPLGQTRRAVWPEWRAVWTAEKRWNIRPLLDLDLVYTWIILVGPTKGFLGMNIFSGEPLFQLFLRLRSSQNNANLRYIALFYVWFSLFIFISFSLRFGTAGRKQCALFGQIFWWYFEGD